MARVGEREQYCISNVRDRRGCGGERAVYVIAPTSETKVNNWVGLDGELGSSDRWIARPSSARGGWSMTWLALPLKLRQPSRACGPRDRSNDATKGTAMIILDLGRTRSRVCIIACWRSLVFAHLPNSSFSSWVPPSAVPDLQPSEEKSSDRSSLRRVNSRAWHPIVCLTRGLHSRIRRTLRWICRIFLVRTERAGEDRCTTKECFRSKLARISERMKLEHRSRIHSPLLEGRFCLGCEFVVGGLGGKVGAEFLFVKGLNSYRPVPSLSFAFLRFVCDQTPRTSQYRWKIFWEVVVVD